jgi:hypothetical protein
MAAMSWKLRRRVDAWREREPGRFTRQAWRLLRQLADYAKDETGQCWPSAAALIDDLGMARRTIFKLLRELQDGGGLAVKHRGLKGSHGGRSSSLYTILLPVMRLDSQPSEEEASKVSQGHFEEAEQTVSKVSHSPIQSVPGTQGTSINLSARAREGTVEAPGQSPAGPRGQRARSHPARHPAHPKTPIVVDAVPPRGRAQPGNGRALGGAPTPAPARAQTFDVEEWIPTPDQLDRLQAVRPDLERQRIEDEVVSFRVWARSKGLKFRDAEECVRRLAGFVRRTHAPRRVAKPKGSAGAERAAPARPASKGKRAAPKQRGRLPGKHQPPQTPPFSREELEGLAARAGCRLTIVSADQVDVHSVDRTTGKTVGTLKGMNARETAGFLQERIDRRQRRIAAQANGGEAPATPIQQALPRRFQHELERLAEAAGGRLQVLSADQVVVNFSDGTMRRTMSTLEAAGYLRRRAMDRKRGRLR